MLRVALILAILANGLPMPMPGGASAMPDAPPWGGLPEAADPHAAHHAPTTQLLQAEAGEEIPADPACQDTAPCAAFCAHAHGAMPVPRLAGPPTRLRSLSSIEGRLLYESPHSDLLTRPPIRA